MSFFLPFPAKALWPNGRAHRMAKSREFKKHKNWAFAGAKASLPRSFKYDGKPVRPRYIITPKTAHKIDVDNAIAAMKAYQDGIALALKVDDSCFLAPVIEFATPQKPGGVEVVLAATDPDQTFDLAAFAKRGVRAHIYDAKGDPSEMKSRIMIAYQHGHLTAHEAEEWIVLQGLEEA